MVNENLEKLVQLARDKKPTDFKEVLTAEIDNRIDAGISEIRADLSKNMFKSEKEITEHCEEAEVEHTHDDGTVHSHEEGGHPHSHGDDGEMIPEGTLPPALQKAIDAKKKDKGDDDEDEDDSPVGKKDENIANFGDKKAKAFTDDDNPTDNKKKKDKKEETEIDEAGSKPLTSKDFKAMANPTHSKSGFTAQAGRFEGRAGVMLDDYVWDDKKMAVKAAQAWIDGFGNSDDYWKNSDKGNKALEKFAKSNKKSWHARAKGENLQRDTTDFLDQRIN
jgi:hypothetical protein